MSPMGEKALTLLRIADLRGPARVAAFDEACRKWSEKAVLRKFEELASRGYIDYGTAPYLGWLTDRGRARLT